MKAHVSETVNFGSGAGDYCETRYETQTVSASAENLVTLTNRGGLVKGILLISRAAGVRTGDRLSQFQGQAIKTTAEVYRLAAERTSGETIQLTVQRGTGKQVVSVKLGEGL